MMLGQTQAQCPPQMIISGTGCTTDSSGVTITDGNGNPLPVPAPPVVTSAQAWAEYNSWLATSNQMASADTQRVMPQLLAEGGAALALLVLAPGPWKLTAIVPAFFAYLTYGLKGGL